MIKAGALAGLAQRMEAVRPTLGGDNVTHLPRADHGHLVRIVEALLFAAAEPLSADELRGALPEGADVEAILADLERTYAGRGVNVVKVAGKYTFRTADDLSFLLRREAVEQKRLSKAALETLAIIAYHQPVTRAEIEDVRGVAISKGTLDQLVEIGWVRMRGRRKVPGRPVTYGTTEAFLLHFGLNQVTDLPGLAELKAAGLLDATVPPGFEVPMPNGEESLLPDEEPLEDPEQTPDLEMHLPEGLPVETLEVTVEETVVETVEIEAETSDAEPGPDDERQ
ncbi:MAG: SMC-Scp complex subunit ScpB [Hyphomicrobiales bacterium]